jgi:hypothetical protein
MSRIDGAVKNFPPECPCLITQPHADRVELAETTGWQRMSEAAALSLPRRQGALTRPNQMVRVRSRIREGACGRSTSGRSSILCEHPLQCVLSKSAVLSGSLENDAVLR